jgi:hypothetical protein
VLACIGALLGIGQRARDALVAVVDGLVDDRAVLGLEAIFLVPDVQRRFLELDFRQRLFQIVRRYAHACRNLL